MRPLAPALAAALALPALAAGGEGITLLSGDTVSAKGTAVSCAVGDGLIRCSKAGGLTATLTKAGKVRVDNGSHRVFARREAGALGRHLRLGVSGGFDVSGASIECHVYVDKGRTISCSTTDARGGLPKSYGFDLSEQSVVVFRYGSMADRHVLKTLPQP